MPRLIREIREALAAEPEDAEEADEGLEDDPDLGAGVDQEPKSLSR